MKTETIAAPPHLKHPDAWAQATAKLSSTAVNVVALLTTAAWFVVVVLVAAALGYFTHWAAVAFTWMPHWMLALGEFLEQALYVLDCVSLFWSVAKHTWHQVKED